MLSIYINNTTTVLCPQNVSNVPYDSHINQLIDWLIDYTWVQNLTAPMHLGLINGPFAPHIKIKGTL